jgi:hypothetical protein
MEFKIIAVAILFRTFLWTRGARPQKCPCPNRSGGCYTEAVAARAIAPSLLFRLLESFLSSFGSRAEF